MTKTCWRNTQGSPATSTLTSTLPWTRSVLLETASRKSGYHTGYSHWSNGRDFLSVVSLMSWTA